MADSIATEREKEGKGREVFPDNLNHVELSELLSIEFIHPAAISICRFDSWDKCSIHSWCSAVRIE